MGPGAKPIINSVTYLPPLPAPISPVNRHARLLDGLNPLPGAPLDWVVALALASNGWITENPNFFGDLLSEFLPRITDEGQLSLSKLNQEIEFFENRGSAYLDHQEMEISHKIAFRLNLLFVLLDHEIMPENFHLTSVGEISCLIESCPAFAKETVGFKTILKILSHFHERKLPPQIISASFKVALSLRFVLRGSDDEIAADNFVKQVYRLKLQPYQPASVWVAARAAESHESLLKFIKAEGGGEVTSLLKDILPEVLSEECFSSTWFPLSSPHDDHLATIERLLDMLRNSKDDILMKLALKIEQKLILQGYKKKLTPRWYDVLPDYLRKFPEDHQSFHSILDYCPHDQVGYYTLFPAELPLEIIWDPAKWLLFLAETNPESAESYASFLSKEDKKQFRMEICFLQRDPVRFFPLYKQLHHIPDLFDPADFFQAFFHILKKYLPKSFAKLDVSEGARLVPWILFLLIMKGPSNSSLRVEPIKGASRTGENLFIDEEINFSTVIQTAPIFSKAFHLFKEGLKHKTLCLEIYHHLFHRNGQSFDEKINPAQVVAQHELNDFINDLKREQPTSLSYALAVDLMLQSSFQQKKKFQIPIDLLTHFPLIHESHPHLRQQLNLLLKAENADECLKITNHSSIHPYDWLKALFSTGKPHFVTAATQLWHKLQHLSQNHENELWSQLGPFLLTNLKRTHLHLKEFQTDDLTTPGARRFIVDWIHAENHTKGTRDHCRHYLLHKFHKTLEIKPDESTEQFLQRVADSLEEKQGSVVIKEAPSSDIKIFTRKEFVRYLEANKDFISVSYYLSIAFEFFYSHYPTVSFLYNQIDEVMHPSLCDCLFSVKLHQIITDKLRGSPHELFCNQSLTSYYPLYVPIMISVNIASLFVISMLGVAASGKSKPATYAKSAKTKKYYKLTSTQYELKVKSVALRYFNAFSSLAIFSATYLILRYFNDPTTPPGGFETRQHCKNVVESYFYEEMETLTNFGVENSQEILRDLKEGICDYQSANQFIDMTLITLLFQTYVISMIESAVPIPLNQRFFKMMLPPHLVHNAKVNRFFNHYFPQSAKSIFSFITEQKKQLIKISALSYGIFRNAFSTYSTYQNIQEGFDNCVKRSTYMANMLGESNDPRVCPKMRSTGQLMFITSLIALQTIGAVAAFAYGKYGYRVTHNQLAKMESYISSKWVMTPIKQGAIRTVKLITTPLVLSFVSLILIKMIDSLNTNYGSSYYEDACLQSMHYRFRSNFENFSQYYPDTSLIEDGVGYLNCRRNAWWESDFQLLPLALCFFYIAGLMSIPLRLPTPRDKSES